MSDLVLLAFKSEDGASQFATEIARIPQVNILKLEDAAVVRRGAGS